MSVIGVHTAFISGFTGRSGIGNYTSRLEIGVSVFFVISGFLLYRPFAHANLADGRPVAVRSFWIRRLKRIVPAYWVAFILITYVLQTDTVRPGFGSALIYLGFAQIYLPSHVLSGILQAWSLCTEMSFYLALPLWAMGMRRLGRDRPDAERFRIELQGLGFLVAMSLAFRVVLLENPGSWTRTMANWLPAYADLFALGMLLAVVSSWLSLDDRRRWTDHPALPWVSWGLAAAAFWLVSNVGISTIPLPRLSLGPALARQTLYGVFAFLMVVPAVLGPQDRGLIRRSLQWRPVALIGVISYGIYLWHEAWIGMVMRWAGAHTFGIRFSELTLADVVLALAAATLSYVLVERPVRSFRRRATVPAERRQLSPAVAGR